MGSVSIRMPWIKPKLPKLTTAALNISSSLMASAPSHCIKSSEATGLDFFSIQTCLSGPTTICRPTMESCTAPTLKAEPCVPVEVQPAIVCPLLAPEAFRDLLGLESFSNFSSRSRILIPHSVKNRSPEFPP